MKHAAFFLALGLGLTAASGCIPGVESRSIGGPGDVSTPDEPPSVGSAGSAGSFGGVGGRPGFTFGSAFREPTTSAAKAPPPLSGGTLLVLADGRTAVASDPDRDDIFVVDVQSERLLATIALEDFDEPGRLIEDADGRVHAVLRRGGAVVTLSGPSWTLAARRSVCPAPRGIAYDQRANLLHVACAGGELVSLPPEGEPTRTLRLDGDLRDVIVAGDKLLVSRFRSAEVLAVAADGTVSERRQPAGSMNARGRTPSGEPVLSTPDVAWRLVPSAKGGGIMVHQEASSGELKLEQGGYGGGGCTGGVVAAVVTRFPASGAPAASAQLMFASLPIDIAQSRDGQRTAVVAAGNAGTGLPFPPVRLMQTAVMDQGGCVPPSTVLPPTKPDEEPIEARTPQGDPVAVAFDGAGRLLVQTREPARIEVVTHRGGSIKLSDEKRFDTGHSLFHSATSSGLACASCHPEGGDDGRVWRFEKLGVRRTQNLRGGVLQTAPFHWDGDMRDLGHLMGEVFSKRMGGPTVAPDKLDALAKWMDRVPALPSSPGDAQAIARGKAVFEDSVTGCTTCHSGALLTTNQSVDVGTGRAFQVPSLRGLAFRAPYMHDGCAKTLADRFQTSCGGAKHGSTSQLSKAQLGDLVSYLESL
jgi:hypothetical protein